ncbi:juvenile hormone esterase [Drosophila mojavensis]|nr:juvenile hormone esterase [Drosophila mojavensis]
MAKTNLCGALCLVLLSAIGYVQADLDVCLEDLGCLHGTLMPDSRQEQFEAFMGIPFAKPPIGELRFKNPVAAGAWTGILDASAPRSHCLQKNYFMSGWLVSGEEDCLYLNVYRPQGNAGPLPVMVYFHFGGFFIGSASPLAIGPEFLMDTQQVVLVTVSYRLGPFGFLSTGDAHMSGNFGLKDQRLALQWVQRHISAFGGNPNLVTLFGHSAGGISSHLHMLSPSSNGLFHRAMSLSGTVMIVATLPDNPLEQARQLAERLGVADAKTLDTQALATALRAMDANDLLKASDVLKQWNKLPQINYGVVVEQPDAPEPFITEYPITAHQAGPINQVPWLLSTTSRVGEGAFFLMEIYTTPQLLKEFNENFLELFGLMLYLPKGYGKETVQEILEIYGVKEMQLNENTLVDIAGILGDFMFNYPVYVCAASYTEYSKEPVSIYSFEYTSNNTFAAILGGGLVKEELGACHMDDGVHTLKMSTLFPDFPQDSENAKVAKRMTSLLVEFAKNGVLPDDTHLQPCKSEEFKDDEICNYFVMGKLDGAYHEAVEKRVDKRALALWKKLYL